MSNEFNLKIGPMAQSDESLRASAVECALTLLNTALASSDNPDHLLSKINDDNTISALADNIERALNNTN